MTGKRYERSTGGLALAFAAALIVAACQSTPPIPTLKTRTLMLHCDREYNDGYLLPERLEGNIPDIIAVN